MAFTFGTQISSGFGAFGATSTPTFGAASAPAFGAAGTPGFGATSTPAFGAPAFPSNSPAFGASSTPAFGASGTLAFGASSSAFSFAAASTPAFGAKSAAAFSFPSASPSSFSAPISTFGQPQSTQFGQQQQQQQQAQQQQQRQLSTKNNQPINDSTAWDDINEQSQQCLLQLEYVCCLQPDRLLVDRYCAAHCLTPLLSLVLVALYASLMCQESNEMDINRATLLTGSELSSIAMSVRSLRPVSDCKKAKNLNRYYKEQAPACITVMASTGSPVLNIGSSYSMASPHSPGALTMLLYICSCSPVHLFG